MGYGHSEPWTLSHEERRISAQAFVDAVGGKAITYVHAHDHSAPESVAFTNHAAEIGADLAMLEVPYEHAKSDQMIYHYFKYVADPTDIVHIVLTKPPTGRRLTPDSLNQIHAVEPACPLHAGHNNTPPP